MAKNRTSWTSENNPMKRPEIVAKVRAARLGKIPWNKGKKCPKVSERMKSNQNPMKRLEVRLKNSKSHIGLGIGSANSMYGKRGRLNPATRSNVRNKISKLQRGSRNRGWKGGEKLRRARNNSKRKEFGYEPLNEPFNGSVGHHLDKVRVINIPSELHKSIPHRQDNLDSMQKINQLAWDFLEASVL